MVVNSQGLPRTGVLAPVPGHSTTHMAITGLGGVVIPYYLNEEQGWELQVKELHRALESAKGVCKPVALYVINPGNPAGRKIALEWSSSKCKICIWSNNITWLFLCYVIGHVQSRKSMQEVIQFASEKRLFLLADEVDVDYQCTMINSINVNKRGNKCLDFSSTGLSGLCFWGKEWVCLLQEGPGWDGPSSFRHSGAGVLPLSIQRLHGRVSFLAKWVSKVKTNAML